MLRRFVFLFAVCALGACAETNSGPARTPAMAPQPAPEPEPVRPAWYERAGEKTWDAVTAPGRWVQNAMPKKAPPPAPPEPLEPPEAIIIERQP